MRKTVLLASAILFISIVTFGFHAEGSPDKAALQPMRILTEDYPPITFVKDGKVTGYATDIVEEILKRLKIDARIELMSWGDAYKIATTDPNVILFSTTRTKERESLFSWIGPIGRYNDILYGKKGSGIKIKKLGDAKKAGKIGTVRGWFSEQFLKDQGFTNLESVDNPAENAAKLMKEDIALSAFTDTTAPEIFKKAGISIDDAEKVFTIKSYDYYIAVSKGTPKPEVKKWQAAFSRIKKDGTLDKIKKKWFPVQ
ncbi:MAG TPA: transporter substrate-binding domain-containing protein [Syntrophorhabdaceae bacterium]|nr:transporter substrate-binding domain-containing protein [Syntrophorhabdaceae bacterium]